MCCVKQEMFTFAAQFPNCSRFFQVVPTQLAHIPQANTLISDIIGISDSLLSSFRLLSVTECQEHSLFSIILSQSGTAGFVISS